MKVINAKEARADFNILRMRKANKLCFKLNNIAPDKKQKRLKLIKKLFGKTGESVKILSPFNCDYGDNITVGENFFANYNCVILDKGKVVFGDRCMLGPNVSIYSAEHPVDPVARKRGDVIEGDIIIGNNVWIGGNSIILKDVHIGDNAVIGAGSVVVKDVEANCLAAGNPAKVIKRF